MISWFKQKPQNWPKKKYEKESGCETKDEKQERITLRQSGNQVLRPVVVVIYMEHDGPKTNTG